MRKRKLQERARTDSSRRRRTLAQASGPRRRASVETLEDRRLLAVLWDRVDPVGSLTFQSDVAGEIGAPVNIFQDDFESGSLDPQAWSTNSSTPNGRVGVSNVLGTPSQSGVSHLTMDTTPAGTFNLNEAILRLDLSGQSEADLSFFHKAVGDETHVLPPSFSGSANGDGVSISEDGQNWHTLVSFNPSNSPTNVYTGFEFDLDAEAAAAGISLGSDFQIKFQQYDNFPFNADGRTFDDVAVSGPGVLLETTTAFLEADQTLTVVASPEDSAVTLTATVRDPSGNFLASATAAGPGETLEIQTIPVSADGDYTVEISGDAASDYALSLYRNAAVEVFDTVDGSEQDATGSFVPLGSGRYGIIGSYGRSQSEFSYSNGPLVNSPGTGVGNADESVLQTVSLGMNSMGLGHQVSFNNRIADDFTITDPAGSSFDTITFFAYQTGSSTTSTMTSVNYQIWDGMPNAQGSSVVFGDTVTNRLIDTQWTGIYRVAEQSSGTATNRPIMANTVSADVTLPAGSYWLDWQSDGTLTSGPWAPPVTITGQTTTGNALSSLNGGVTWNSALDSGTETQQDFPFIIGSGSLGPAVAPASTAISVGDTAQSEPDGGSEFIDDFSPPPILTETPDIYGEPGEPGRFPPGPNVPAQEAQGDLLVNGSFETGDFTGWTTVTTGNPFREWDVSTAAAPSSGRFGMLQTQPQDGSFVAWNGFDGSGPMEFQMFQDVDIPAGSTATLNWMDRVQWNFEIGQTATLPRLYDVEIRDPATNAVLQSLYSFSTGTELTDPNGNTNWQTHSEDLSAFAGQTVRLFFREQIPQTGTGPGQIEFDAISLTTDLVPIVEPDVDEYLLDLTGIAGQPIDIALSTNVRTSPDDQIDLAIIVSEADTPIGAPVDQLAATGLFDSITVFNAHFDTPTLEYLQEFETVLAYTNFAPLNAVELGDVLADYVDSGGQLAMANYAYSNPWSIAGRITSTGYSPLTNLGINGPVSGAVVASAPSDPIFDGIDLNALTYFNNINFATPGVDAGATLLATDGTGTNMIARNADGNVIGLNLWPKVIAGNNQELFDLIGNTLVPEAIGGSGEVTLELLDVDGTTVLATGEAGAENFDLGILEFVVPADGVYTIRTTSEGVGQYGIVVTEPLVFDTEPNQPSGSSLRSLDAYDGALGFLSDETVGGDVDLSLLNSFESLTIVDSGYIPPDPIIAAGPTSVIGMVNTDIVIHDKATGAVIAQADLDGPGGFWGTNNVVFDPWIVYDPESERFFAMGIDRVRGVTEPSSSRVYLAVSTDSTPGNLTTDWYKYTIDRTGTSLTGAPTFPDYPKLGLDDDAIYITANDYGIDGGGFSHVSIFAIDKAPLLNGGSANIVYDEVIRSAFSIHPVVNYDPGEPMRFAEALGTTGIRIHTIDNVLNGGTRTTSTVGVPTFNFPPDVPQLGGPPLDSVGQRIMSGVVRDGSLWTGHAIQDPAVDSETVMRWYEFDVTGPTPTLVQNGNVDPGPGIHTWMGHVNVDNDGDMGIAFSISGADQYAGIGYTGRLASDPLGTTQPVQIAREGEGPYSRIDSIGRNRWGDYSGLAIDPDGQSFWLFHEYAGAGGIWATFVGQFEVEPGGVPTTDVDAYEITLSAGQQIAISTTTPFDDPIDGLNLLDPSLEILGPTGASVAFDADGADDGKNVSLPTFVAATSGVYKVVVGAEDDGDGEYVLSFNWGPELGPLALSAGMIFENDSVSLSSSYSDQNLDDSHSVVVEWGDPNDGNDSTFDVAAINTLTVGDTFGSSTDTAVLTITSLDLLLGLVGFDVTDHQYLDDGLAPGNGTPADESTINVTVTDSGELTTSTLPKELIVNGDFETGDLGGWTVTNSGSAIANWEINDGTNNPPGPAGPLPVISGDFDALSVTAGPNLSILSEPIAIPDVVSSAVISWSDRIRNFANRFEDPNQEWRVLVLDTSGELIQEVYSTNPGDPLIDLGPNDRSVDLTTLFQSLAGQTVQISFEQQSQIFWFNVSLDNVSLVVDSGASLLVKNVAPQLAFDPVAMINENESAIVTGTITDPGLLDEHDVVIDWDDPNATGDATFTLPATAVLSVGDTFASTTDGAILTVTGVDLSIGEVSFSTEHVYADDGSAPGNNTPSDVQLISASVSDDDGLTPSNVPTFREPVNLSPVNTTLNDAAPTLSADGLTMYFHSNRAGGNGGADIWQATRPSLAEPFGTPTNIGNVVNGGANDTAPALSKDGLSLYFSSTRSGANGSSDLYVATRASTSDSFGAPVNLGTGVNTSQPEFAPAISADGLSLYFQRAFGAGGVGSSDIWVSTRVSTSDPFGTAVNLGAPVNSIQFDGGPFVSDDGLALYIASSRPGGEGGLDLYLSTRASVGDEFGTPINLGVPINTTQQDFNAHIGPDGLYFHSSRPGGVGGSDLWFAPFSASQSVLVKNVAPSVDSVTVSAAMDSKAVVDEPVILSSTFTDPGLLDRHEVVIEWDDGSANSVFDLDATADLASGDTFVGTDGSTLAITAVDLSTGEVSYEVSHQFSTGGIFEVIVTVSDDDTGTATDSAQAWVTGLRIDDGVLQVIGSSENDKVTINAQGKQTLKVHADFLASGNFETFPLADVEKIVAYLCEGDDHFTIAGNVDIPAIVHGGADDDHLNAGGGSAVLLGESGNDMLVGGTNRDVLIGGLGTDRLVGGKGDDVLIGGSTNVDNDDDALMDVLAAWTADDSYENRVAAVDALLTVDDDEEEDQLTGSSDQDLFYDGLGDKLNDVKTKKDVEIVL